MGNRILLVSPSNNGTIGLCTLNLYKAFLKREDIEVKCVLVHKFENGYKEFEDCEWCVSNTSKYLDKFLALFNQINWLKKIKREFKPDITISTLFGCSTINVLSGGRDKKIGVFHSPHTQVKIKGKLEYWATIFSYKYIYSHLDKLFCVSNEVKESIINSFQEINPKKVEVVYNVHDIDLIKEKGKEIIDDLKEAEIFSHPVILYCGRLDRNKAPERLLKAFLNVNFNAKVQLVYIGDDTDNLQRELEMLVKQKDASGLVHFLGRKSNPYKYMKNACILASSSYSEGLPGVLIESLILGTPVVATNSSEGIWEILSCHNEYSFQLDSVHSTSNGIITSNLSLYNKENYDKDIANLEVGLKSILENRNKYCNDFKFQSQIEADGIVQKYL